ncbi:uncharacterized protein TRAVEDRAFT_23129 [Trametes versicolor FP-101664 SS1]|uniref:uncharacterized protein n=1 Tax=Trametes versicolor (strain FP-101664) TaxID=717944 RepID=UPI000462161D|nr:uncharacterized protein TRAVEDRAFT_23129 [Trametes versicolor FP-101664 SS1]EIW53849.1 hypothetical protein TRAVEDRAFT_23129 [Trametes versicolor FP-101664 SS1]
MFSKNLAGLFFAVAATFAVCAKADDSAPPAATSLPSGIPIPTTVTQCAQSCISQAALQNGCADPSAEVTCICKNPLFIQGALQCVQKGCPPEDSVTALQAYEQICGAPASGPATAVPTATGFSTLSSPASSSASGSASASDHISANSTDSSKHSGHQTSSGATSASSGVSQSTLTTVSVSSSLTVTPAGSTTTVLPTTPTSLEAAANASSGSASGTDASSSGVPSAPPAPSSSAPAASQTKNAATARRIIGGGSGMGGVMGVGVAILGVAFGAGFVL